MLYKNIKIFVNYKDLFQLIFFLFRLSSYKKFKDEINIKSNFDDIKYNSIKVFFNVNFYFVLNKDKYYGKHNTVEVEGVTVKDELYYYINDVRLPNILNFKFSTIENLHE